MKSRIISHPERQIYQRWYLVRELYQWLNYIILIRVFDNTFIQLYMELQVEQV